MDRKSMIFRRLGLTLAYALLAWISISVVAYGLALHRFGLELKAQPITQEMLRDSELDTALGRVASSTQGWSGHPGVRFTLDGVAEPLFIPHELFADAAKEKLLTQYLKIGTKLRARARKPGRVVVELHANPDTAFQKLLISRQEALPQLTAVPDRAIRKARFLLVLGFGLVPAALALQFGRARFMKTVRKA